jgi:vanillate O-demethylase monooxygenase subunit
MSAYVRNAWYAAAWEEEVEDSSFLARTLLDETKVLYRKQDRSGVMLSDRCPHRFAPLHKGRRDGDAIVCPYQA